MTLCRFEGPKRALGQELSRQGRGRPLLGSTCFGTDLPTNLLSRILKDSTFPYNFPLQDIRPEFD